MWTSTVACAPPPPVHCAFISIAQGGVFGLACPSHLCFPVVRQALLQQGQHFVRTFSRSAHEEYEAVLFLVLLVQFGKLVQYSLIPNTSVASCRREGWGGG